MNGDILVDIKENGKINTADHRESNPLIYLYLSWARPQSKLILDVHI